MRVSHSLGKRGGKGSSSSVSASSPVFLTFESEEICLLRSARDICCSASVTSGCCISNICCRYFLSAREMKKLVVAED